MQILKDISLTLFFTSGVGLNTWAEVGNLDREVAIYKRLTEHLGSVNFVTYGGRDDWKYADLLGDINLYPTLWNGSKTRNIARLLVRHWRIIKESDILKTNQISGSEIPVWLKKKFGKKLIVRCGYLLSRVAVNSNHKVANASYAHKLEKYSFTNADLGIVTTQFNRNYVIENYGVDPNKIIVIPNYVDTDTFKPIRDTKKECNIVFVGRAGKEKNLNSLLEAIIKLRGKGQDLKLLLIGGCSSDKELQELAKVNRIKVSFKENVRHDLIPDLLNKAKIFILPSLYEGHPKALLEAMSCALPCIGSEVEGIKELIDHRVTGYLCKTDSQSIADAIETVLSDEALCRTMGENARRYIVKNYALEKVLKMELDVIREVIAR